MIFCVKLDPRFVPHLNSLSKGLSAYIFPDPTCLLVSVDSLTNTVHKIILGSILFYVLYILSVSFGLDVRKCRRGWFFTA